MLLYWDRVPLITKYDVIAIRWTNNVQPSTYFGIPEASGNARTNYLVGDDNIRVLSKGLGITMNMYDNKTNHKMTMQVRFNSYPGEIFGTYQHARH